MKQNLVEKANRYLKEEFEDEMPAQQPTKTDKIIRTSYETWDEEALEAGDTDEKGWEDEKGQSMLPDEIDVEEGITTVDNAVGFLKDKGVIQSSRFQHPYQ